MHCSLAFNTHLRHMRVQIIRHEAVPKTGSYDIRFPDGRPSRTGTLTYCWTTSAGLAGMAGDRRRADRPRNRFYRFNGRSIFQPRPGYCLQHCGGWSRDVSEDLADEIARRCAMDGCDVPPLLEGFIARHGSGRPADAAAVTAARRRLGFSSLRGCHAGAVRRQRP